MQYKGFPLTISMANGNTGTKPVAKAVKLDVTPNAGVPYWMKEVTVSKDTTESSELDAPVPFDLPEDADPDIPFGTEPAEEPEEPNEEGIITEPENVEPELDEEE